MDFLNRNGQSTQPARPAAAPGAAPQHAPVPHEHKGNHLFGSHSPSWLRVANVVLLFSMTILAVSIAWMLHTNNPNESKYIVADKYQAVFLENGQVYFGKITSLNSRNLNLQSVFYLNSQNSSSDSTKTDSNASNQFTLVKLGCELHGPYDQMVVNRDQVTFWENLKDDGQVVKTIKNGQSRIQMDRSVATPLLQVTKMVLRHRTLQIQVLAPQQGLLPIPLPTSSNKSLLAHKTSPHTGLVLFVSC